MHDRTVLLMLAFSALLLLPAATALSLGSGPTAAAALDSAPQGPADVAPIVQEATSSIPAAPALDTALPSTVLDASLPLARDGQIGISANVEASAAASASASSDDSVAGPESAAASTQPLREQLADVAVPAAGSAIVALLVGALALGAEGLRLLQAKAAGVFGKFGRLLAGAIFAFPLFSRIERSRLLDNPVRARVHDAVTQDPGISLSDVSARAGIAWGTAVHHLRRLEAHDMVVSVTRSGHRRFFAANTPAATQRAAVSVVMHPTARRIAHLVSQRPGIDQTGICKTLNLNNPAASKHLHQFEAQGLVLSQRTGRSRHYHPTGGMHSALLLLEPASGRVTTAMNALEPIPAAYALVEPKAAVKPFVMFRPIPMGGA